MGDSVSLVALKVLNSGNFPTSFNHTHVTLVPKKDRAEKIGDFRPINLYNVLYKIAAKVIANRLKLILPSIISRTQSASV